MKLKIPFYGISISVFQVLAHTDKNQTTVEDLNHSFGPLIFERVAIAQSESLLAYLISTCEFIIS